MSCRPVEPERHLVMRHEDDVPSRSHVMCATLTVVPTLLSCLCGYADSHIAADGPLPACMPNGLLSTCLCACLPASLSACLSACTHCCQSLTEPMGRSSWPSESRMYSNTACRMQQHNMHTPCRQNCNLQHLTAEGTAVLPVCDTQDMLQEQYNTTTTTTAHCRNQSQPYLPVPSCLLHELPDRRRAMELLLAAV